MTAQNYVHTQQDNLGDIAVLDEGDYRILSFGYGDEQSRQLKSYPHILQHQYTQAMMIPLLFSEPKRVLLLGLGAGCLLSALHHAVPGVRLTAVELRQSVIDVAKKYFRLPSSKKIDIHCSEAALFLQQGMAKKVDLIMTDLYHDQGMDAVQCSGQYLALCAEQLKDNGWLVLNCWGGLKDQQSLLEQLMFHFTDIRSCDVGAGNLVIFAGKIKDTQSMAALKEQANKKMPLLGFNLQRVLAKLEAQ